MSVPGTSFPGGLAHPGAQTPISPALGETATWYKDAIIYELHVRAFRDGSGDGFGDFRGLIQRLDYLRDLGVTAVWLLPFYDSPLRDDGYDIADYMRIHPSYGRLRDFTRFLKEAHRRDLRVITELVLNHTSDQHAWFQRARSAPTGSANRDFYVWSDTPERFAEARVIFSDFETSNWTWDPVAGAYYWHRFYSHQPDLNYDNPEVRSAMLEAVDFMLNLGVDGLRLDAVPYLFERENTNCENLPETFAFLKELRRHVDAHFGDRMLLAEANQWPEDATAYFGDGDICQMAFHFPLMPRMFMAMRMEDRFPIIDILHQTPPIPETAQWGLFLRNHDELTLEMVTDEERDYMYRAYARDQQSRINLGIRRRLAPLLGNDRRLIELANILLFSLPGTPIIYYGDEIGMGDNVYLGDRNGVRTPMQWSADRNAGFSEGNPQSLYMPLVTDPEYTYAAINVEAQAGSPSSLLWWMRRLTSLRRHHPSLARGDIRFISPDNRKVLVYLREHEGERILVVVNLSRRAQFAELPLQEFSGITPIELFGQTTFPAIGELPYLLTMAPYGYYWFLLPDMPEEPDGQRARTPTLRLGDSWHDVFLPASAARLARALSRSLPAARWFAGKAREMRSMTIVDAVPLAGTAGAKKTHRDWSRGALVLARVEYGDGEPETYLLPLRVTTAEGDGVDPASVLARLHTTEGEYVLCDAASFPEFGDALIDAMLRPRRLRGFRGRLVGSGSQWLRKQIRQSGRFPAPTILGADQSNTSLVYGRQAILKFLRRPVVGESPELEIGRFLTTKARLPSVPKLSGSLEYVEPDGSSTTVAVLHRFVENEGTVWSLTLDTLRAYLSSVAASPEGFPTGAHADESLLELASRKPPPRVVAAVGGFLDRSNLLGRRTAELHLALAGGSEPGFAPEPFSRLFQRSLYQSLRLVAMQSLRRARQSGLGGPVGEIVDREREILERLRAIVDLKIAADRIRVHGDYHLGQVLDTGRDFVIIDFEGEPGRPLAGRRLKRAALEDVAGMVRSFHYAAATAVSLEPDIADEATVRAWADTWYRWVAAAFLRGYFDTCGDAAFIPSDARTRGVLLSVLLLGKATYELGYELDHRPAWVETPARGIVELLATEPTS